MSNLNYFMPYRHAEGHHENPLTRAFLTSMRYSPSLLLAFYQMVRDALSAIPDIGPALSELPKLHELELDDVSLVAQSKSLGREVSRLVSVLITDETGDFPQPIVPVERDAVYDGLISFGNDMTLFIENKLRVNNVWHGQLCPSAKDVPEGAVLLPRAAVLRWREIIEMVNKLISTPAISGAERTVLFDLRDYINQYHAYLNSYREFGQCGNSHELILLRIKAVLEEIAADKELVRYHHGWGYYIAVEGHPGIDRVALTIHPDQDDSWKLELFIGFADTVTQARAFYQRKLEVQQVARLRELGWDVKGNFHLSHMQRHLYWYATSDDRVVDYLTYWSAHVRDIRQYDRDELHPYLQGLFKADLLEDSEDKRADYERHIAGTNRSRINLAPGLLIRRFWTSDQAVSLDGAKQFSKQLREKLREGFTFIGERPTFLAG